MRFPQNVNLIASCTVSGRPLLPQESIEVNSATVLSGLMLFLLLKVLNILNESESAHTDRPAPT